MRSLLRTLRSHCAVARSTLLQAACAVPFPRVSGTPLQAVAGDYLALITGAGLFGGTGSAVVLRPGLAVTSRHVVDGIDRLTVLSAHGPVEAVVRARSERLDLALLGLPDGFGTGIPVARAVAGTAMWAMGTTTGGLAPVAAGLVETVTASARLGDGRGGPEHRGLMYAAPAGPGYSGGPVVDAEGRLIGITEGIYTHLLGPAPVAWPRLPRLFAYHAADIRHEAAALLQCEIDNCQIQRIEHSTKLL